MAFTTPKCTNKMFDQLSSFQLFLLFLLSDMALGSCEHKDNTTCAVCVTDFNCYWCEHTRHCGDKTLGRHFLGKIRTECGGGEWYSYKQVTFSCILLAGSGVTIRGGGVGGFDTENFCRILTHFSKIYQIFPTIFVIFVGQQDAHH